jgi:gliding motility-associated-like protein
MKKALQIFLSLVLVISCYSNALSQKESNIWYFGQNAGISFSTDPPKSLTNGMLNTTEGCASISDGNGNLLFYTDGMTIWNKNHIIMDNGTGLKGHKSATQSSIIAPKPASDKIYYVFTTGYDGGGGLEGLQYSEVDISMNGGLGKVIKKNIILIQPSSEKVTIAIHSNNNDYWVITHGVLNAKFYSFLVTSSGVNLLPFISTSGHVNKNGQGYLKAANNNKRLISAANGDYLELFDFNNLNGKVSNAQIIDSNDQFYGVEFSPDINKLYVSAFCQFYQYNLLSANILKSKRSIYNCFPNSAGALQIGIDKKIYCSESQNNYLSVINKPNDSICNFVIYGIDLKGRKCSAGLPNIIPSLIIPDTTLVASFVASEIIICQGEQVAFTNKTIKPCTGQNWLLNGVPFDTNKNTSYIFKNVGDYTISLIVSKDAIVDTAIVLIHVNPIKNTSLNLSICQGDTFKIGINNYTNKGTYYDTLTTFKGCDSIVTTNLQIIPNKKTTINPFICPGDSFAIGTHYYRCSGTYFDTLKSYTGCDSILTTKLSIILVGQTTINPFICSGDSFKMGNHYYYSAGFYNDTITANSGCDSIVFTNLQVKSVGQTTINPFICPGESFTVGIHNYSVSGTFFDSLKTNSGCDSIVTTNLHVIQPKSNFLSPDTTFCFDKSKQLLLDGGEASEYLWYPTLETGRYQNIISEGIYSLEIKDSTGCVSNDSINVFDVCEMTLYVPNAFAPNGINIVFKAYGTSIKNIELKIFSRWGELIYEVTGTEDISWNGKFNNELCPQGVYYYSIKARGGNGEKKEKYGSVHLLR